MIAFAPRAKDWCLFALLPLMALFSLSATSFGQSGRLDTIELRSGGQLRGQIDVVDGKLAVVRKRGRGVARHLLPFERVAPHSLYSILVTRMAPLDFAEHRLVANAAFDAKLFFTAAKHYRAAVEDEERVERALFDRIDLSEKRDLEEMLVRSRAALEKEDFRQARRLALRGLKRYGERPKEEVAHATKQLETISQARAAAEDRRKLARARAKDRKILEAQARAMRAIDVSLERARRDESRGLQQSRSLRRSRSYYGRSLRHLRVAGKGIAKLRHRDDLATQFRDRLDGMEDTIIDGEIRLRLHIASLYTLRGSYGNAMGFVNEALSIDPTDDSALAARRNIEQAAAAASAPGVILR